MIEELPFCKCGCGERVGKPRNKFIHGHQMIGRKLLPKSIEKRTKTAKENKLNPKPKLEHQLCGCGCGGLAKPGNRFLRGHNKRVEKVSDKTRLNMSKAKKGIPYSIEHRDANLKEKDPLPDNWEIDKDSKTVTNKNSPNYLGCYIAEQLLIKIFKNTKRMPYGNHGFDFYCGNEYRIDSKSSATGKKGYWQFGIKKNIIADYFILLAFESRDDINPTHLWLIQGNVINNLKTLTISKSNLKKWSKYEQPIDKARECCDEMRNNINSEQF